MIDTIEPDFLRALQTLMALPDRDRGLLEMRTAWPPYAREFMDAYGPDEAPVERFKPTPHDISIYLDVLAWGRDLDRIARQILIWKAAGASFRRIGDLLDVSHEAARQRYLDAFDQIRAAAHAAQARERAPQA